MNIKMMIALNKNILILLLVIVVFIIFGINHFFGAHPAIGVWGFLGAADPKPEFSVFNDNTAILYSAGKNEKIPNAPCEWSEKNRKTIVLKCDLYGSGKNDFILTFKVESSQVGHITGHSESKVKRIE